MNLEREGYSVTVAEDGASGLDALRTGDFDLLILDVMLPRLNGYELLRTKLHEAIATPVLVLSARTDDQDKVRGLDLGADDYVTKPFSVPELLARVRAALRRSGHQNGSPDSKWRFGDVVVNPSTRQVHKAGEPVELTVTEFNVLATLARTGGEALSRQQIFEAVWGKDHHGTHRTIDNFLAQLRSKLEDNPARPKFLLTIRGVGYRLARD
ncbi:MAG TPA: response regulator transcription factor [Polyangiaceae bacterium]|nr:response regulator transcription factor [Polyangiaceae bacterium]